MLNLWIVIKSQSEELGKTNNIANIALKTARKEIKESDIRQQNVIKKDEEKIEELLALKEAKVHEIKVLKKEKKKLNKKLNSFVNSDTKPEENEATLNENEVSVKVETSMLDLSFALPIANSFEKLGNLEDETFSHPKQDNTKKELLDKEEASIREKVKMLVRNFFETKVIKSGVQVSDEDLELLEKELTEEMEELVQEKLNTLRDLLDRQELFEQNMKFGTNEDSSYDEGPTHQFYWGPEGDIIFVDD